MSLPEGLHLALTPDEEPGIFDAQDVCHIIFTDGGLGDPTDWQASFIRRTCDELGISYGADNDGNFMTIGEFIEMYHGDLTFNE